MLYKYRILIIDDEPLIRDLFTHSLEDLGEFSCVSAKSAEEALALLEKNRIDLCIVDMRLPDMSGEQFIIQAWRKGYCNHFIIHTGSIEASTSDAISITGVTSDDIFYKPTEHDVVISRILQKLTIKN